MLASRSVVKVGNLLILGCNQSDAVNIKAFPVSRVPGYRWPTDVPVSTESLQVLSNVQLSEREA